MKEVEFKLGENVFDLRYGFGTIIEIRVDNWESFIIVKFKMNNGEKSSKYTTRGKLNYLDFNRSLLTLEEAKLLGFEPEKKKNKFTYYQALIRERDGIPEISKELFEIEDEAYLLYGPTFVKLLTDRPIEIEIDE